MSSGKGKGSFPFNKTQIKDGKIVRLRKDGRIKAIIGEYKPNHPKNNSLNRTIS
jgi:hypothetical protein